MTSLPDSKWAMRPAASFAPPATEPASTTLPMATPSMPMACSSVPHLFPRPYSFSSVGSYPPPFMPAFPSALPDMWQPRAEPFLVPPKKTVVRISAPPPPTTNSAPGIKTLPARSSAPPSTLAPASSSTLLDSPAPEASGTSLLETTDLLTFQPSPPLRLPSLESSSPPVVPEGCLLPTFDPTSSSPTVEPLTIAPSNSLLKDDDSFWTTRSTGQGHTNIEPIVGQAKTLAIQDTSLSSEPSSITKAFSHPSQPPTSSSRISSHSTMSANKPSNSPTSSNPWQTFVEDADPDGTMDDGRGYVGGPRHYVDNPGRPSVRPNAPPPSQPQPRPPAAPTQPQPRPPAAPAQQPAKKPLAPAPRAPSPPRESTPQSRGFIQRKSPFADRQPHANSVWSGQKLLSAGQFTPEFFSTAKPKVPGQSQVSQSLNQGGPTPRPPMQVPITPPRVQPPMNSPVRQAPERPAPSPVTSRFGTSRDFQDNDPRPSVWDRDDGPAERPPPSRFRNESEQEAMMFRRERANSMDRTDNSDGESVVAPQRMGQQQQPARAVVQPDLPGDPLFLQYPIGDGCHVVVAMYVERDPAIALRRFPTLQRTRLTSGHKAKTMDQMAAIFQEALEDEKEACLKEG